MIPRSNKLVPDEFLKDIFIWKKFLVLGRPMADSNLIFFSDEKGQSKTLAGKIAPKVWLGPLGGGKIATKSLVDI